jgi:hypothetical protein
VKTMQRRRVGSSIMMMMSLSTVRRLAVLVPVSRRVEAVDTRNIIVKEASAGRWRRRRCTSSRGDAEETTMPTRMKRAAARIAERMKPRVGDRFATSTGRTNERCVNRVIKRFTARETSRLGIPSRRMESLSLRASSAGATSRAIGTGAATTRRRRRRRRIRRRRMVTTGCVTRVTNAGDGRNKRNRVKRCGVQSVRLSVDGCSSPIRAIKKPSVVSCVITRSGID